MRWKLWIGFYSGALVFNLFIGMVELIHSTWGFAQVMGWVNVGICVPLGYMIYWNFKKLRQEREREAVASEPK